MTGYFLVPKISHDIAKKWQKDPMTLPKAGD
jgi:hypothetical protein